ncbi:MAG: biopolymer transporter ExbD [Rhizobiales bacterium NRL2]|jgi:biopolymer transport protein ExbD|nr:MAG: biopolymer transporter ExbD [Rhizobiales bacterium NRL2]
MSRLSGSRRRPRNDDDRIMPLINLVFLLLIFFMLAGRLTAADPFEIAPPESASGADPVAEEMLILVAADGRLALDGAMVSEAELAERLGREPRRVRLKADAEAEAVRVVQVMEVLRDAGVENLHLLTVPAGR